ncbi:MAG: tRNA (N(6)-L-threonylcarbamoyladenosine(37)-C(2))-methylthiotransferase MtaB [Ignavibacteria bacterium]|jgi:threonylcarbamoyladenosine tRNA methylthiotransferase MtaB
MSNKVALHTLGCKLNFSETSTIGKQFLSKGFDIVDFSERADVYVFNTCTVTENAERECRQLVRRILRYNPEAYVIVTGCYAQLRPEELSNINGVDAVVGSNEKFQLFNILNNFEKGDQACVFVESLNGTNEFGEAHSTDADNRTRAYFKIQDGCDYKCSFCTIPLARGESRSMEPSSAVDEFKKLVEQDYKEIILTGVNVGDYGKSVDSNLYELLTKFLNVEGKFRIRISSIEPNLLTNDLIDLIADNDKICNHLHIPLQSGSNRILKAMQRRYTVSEYKKVIYNVCEKIKNPGIGIDVIVGFPGETENDFLETHNFVRDLPVSYLHVFTYSERPDTGAIKIENSVDNAERKRRNKILRILSEKKRHQFYQNMIGQKHQVLFEEQNSNGKMKGFTSNYVRVENKYDNSCINKLIKIELTDLTQIGLCTGKIIDTKNSIEIVSS